MDYPLENLDADSFQELCQGLIVLAYPDAQCFPIAQPDGGRDATSGSISKGANGVKIFQVKFVRRSDLDEHAHKKLITSMEREVKGFKRTSFANIQEYILITNVRGTGHLDTGAIDRMQQLLSKSLPIPASVWWRDDVCRRLDSAWDLKWRFPQVMTSLDLLRILIERGESSANRRHHRTISAFLAHQYDEDSDVKFKQVGLQNSLASLYVDVPVAFKAQMREGRSLTPKEIADRKAWRSLTGQNEIQHVDFLRALPPLNDEDKTRIDPKHTVGVSDMLLDRHFQVAVSSLLLEGAPGQGKSTVSQYVCQVHRARLLNRPEPNGAEPAGQCSGPLRLPFRVDLRDLASWINCVNPFGKSQSGDMQDLSSSLEGFLCFQIRRHSGGTRFTVDDLLAVFADSPVLIVLDGLDEVADIDLRGRLISEILLAQTRIAQNTKSLQTLVTSRPSVFSNSPGLPSDRFTFFELRSLETASVFDYSEKWMRSRGISEEESETLRKVLRDKIDLPHLRELARNPMQLAILLTLMHKRGASLPSKRTDLYQSYLELFLDREGDKSDLVQKHRELIIGIHGHLAWLLQGDAQSGTGSRGISLERLQNVVRGYIEARDYEAGVLAEFFSGALLRIYALVSRVEGIYEFEVQPIREYFAAHYLHKTSPNSPSFTAKAGTLPARFDALARDAFWFNVIRFFCGFFTDGEQYCIKERLEVLLESEDYSLSSHPRAIGIALLADHVFVGNPRLAADIVATVFRGRGLKCFIAEAKALSAPGIITLELPGNQCKERLLSLAFGEITQNCNADYRDQIIEFALANFSPELVERHWRQNLASKPTSSLVAWLIVGFKLGIDVFQEDLFPLLTREFSVVDKADALLELGRPEMDLGSDNPAKEDRLLALLFKEQKLPKSNTLDPEWARIAQVVELELYALLFRSGGSETLSELWHRLGFQTDYSKASMDKLKVLWSVISRVLKMDGIDLIDTTTAWSELIASIVEAMPGPSWSAVVLATGLVRFASTRVIESINDIADDSNHYNFAVLARKKKDDPRWWREVMSSASAEFDRARVILAATLLSSRSTFTELFKELDDLACGLSEAYYVMTFEALIKIYRCYGIARKEPLRQGHQLTSECSRVPFSIAPFVFLRSNRVLRDCIYKESLRQYSGQALPFLSLQFNHGLTMLRESSSSYGREFDLAAIKNAYYKGAVDATKFLGYDDGGDKSEFVLNYQNSINILESWEAFPTPLLNKAESMVSSTIFSEVTPVAKVAERESWWEHV